MGIEVPVGEVQIVLRWLSSGDPEEMISTIGASGVPEGDTLQEMAVALQALTQTNLSPANLMYTGWTFQGVTLYRAQDGGGAEVAESNSPVVGSAGGQTLTSNTALLVKKQTALSGRRNRGRMYLPPFSLGEGAVSNNGTIDSQAHNEVSNQITAWFNAVQTYLGTEDLVLFHSLGGSSGTEVLPSTPISSLQLDTKVATQRRRMR